MRLKDEPKYKMVLTTSYVLCNDSPITFVLYDEDGDWQLFSDEEVGENEDAYSVTVEEILEMEPALRKLPDMEKGQGVAREKDSKRWIFVEDED